MTRKKAAILGLLAFALTVSTAFGTSMLVTVMSVTRFGPFHAPQTAYVATTGGQPGGAVRLTRVGGTTDTLLIGDVVYWSDSNRVLKSATLANYQMIAGVVVGGARTSDRASIVAADVGTVAATTGQLVWILKSGRTWMKSSQNAAIITGRRVVPSDSIAGRFDTLLTASIVDTFYRFIGRTVSATGALGSVLVDVNIK